MSIVSKMQKERQVDADLVSNADPGEGMFVPNPGVEPGSTRFGWNMKAGDASRYTNLDFESLCCDA